MHDLERRGAFRVYVEPLYGFCLRWPRDLCVLLLHSSFSDAAFLFGEKNIVAAAGVNSTC